MEMLQCHFILASLLVLNGCFFEASCQTVYTYTTKDAESLPCTKTEQTGTVTWDEIVDGNPPIRVLSYQSGTSPPVTKSTEEKYKNFNFALGPTFLNMDILNVEDGDEGAYACAPFDVGGSRSDVIVEVLVKPSVQYESQDVDVLNVTAGTSYDLNCSATGARSVSDLSLVWDPSIVVKTPLSVTPSGNYKDYSITSTYTAVRGVSSITCQINGYVMQDEINDQRMGNISHTVNLNVQYAPVCNMTIPDGEDCREVTLTCECEAVPAAITQYSFFNGSSNINDGPSKMFTVSVVYGTSTGFSCSATNAISPGDKSDVKVHECKKDPDFPKWVIILIIVVVLAVVIAVIAVIMYKKGKCGSNSSSDKLDDNGAGPAVVTEPPTYGKIDKNRTKDPTPAPRSSMRDSKNPSNPKQDGPMEMQYADLDHGNKPPSDEVRKPKEEPTEYATVQSVIV